MIKINLLSPFDKDNLRWEKINNLTIRSVVWILIAEALFAILFVFSTEYLRIEKESVEVQLENMRNATETREMERIESDFAAYKGRIESIYAIQERHRNWTPLFEELSRLVPGGVRLESVITQEGESETVSKTGKKSAGNGVEPGKIKIVLTGNARTREDLLEFESNLKSSDFFSDIQCDDANYVKSIDVDFNHTFYIADGNLLK